MNDRQRIINEIHAVLAIVPPDEWTTEDCAAVLAVYSDIARKRSLMTDSSVGNVIPMRFEVRR